MAYNFKINKIIHNNTWFSIDVESPISNLDRITKVNIEHERGSNIKIQIRYSADYKSWSEWADYPKSLPLIDFIYLSFRVKSDTNVLLKNFTLDWEGGKILDEKCNCFTTQYDNSNSFFIDSCDIKPLYLTGQSALNIFTKTSLAVFKKCQVPIIYFKCNPVKQSRDVIFKEWSLLKVTECKQIGIVVNENDFGSMQYQFNDYDVEFSEDLNFTISKELFWAAFGQLEQPAEKDFFYLPLLNRLYRVNSCQENRGFMLASVWWDINAVKYNDSESIIKSDDISSKLDELTLKFSDGFDLEQEEEQIDIIKPQQFNTRYIGKFDKTRDYVNVDWENKFITELNLLNNYVMFSKYQYDLNYLIPKDYNQLFLNTGDKNSTFFNHVPLIEYNTTINTKKDFSIMFWYNGNNRNKVTVDFYQTIFSGGVTIQAKIDNTNKITKLKINNIEYQIDIPCNEWYAYYIGFNQLTKQMTIRIWKRNQTKNSINMDIQFESNYSLPILSNWKPILMNSGDKICQIRIIKHTVTIEEQCKLFTKNIYPDDSDAYIIDNCYKTMYMEKINPR